jgi:hypothetical protein
MSARLRDDSAWRAMFKRCHAKDAARRRVEAQRWRGLSPAEKWAEMASTARRWRGLGRPGRIAEEAAKLSEGVIDER